MSSDESTPLDVGLLSPVTAGSDSLVSDAAVAAALVTAELALMRAWGAIGAAPDAVAPGASDVLGWAGAGLLVDAGWLDPQRLARAASVSGDPVAPLVQLLQDRVAMEARVWVQRGASNQDVLDSALMLVSRRAGRQILTTLRALETQIAGFAVVHRDDVTAARAVGQQTTPTTIGARAAGWLRGVTRARVRLAEAVAALPAQWGGEGGTLAAVVELGGADAAAALPAAFAAELDLATPDAPWHVTRWPVTELGDGLAQALDAVGKIAADVTTLSRTELGELQEADGATRGPVGGVLVRSAALRAPQLAATLHLAATLAADERPDGSWHAEWPTLRELLRLALGATEVARSLVSGLRVDAGAVEEDLARTGGQLVSERLTSVLAPVVGADEVRRVLSAATDGGDLRELVREALEVAVDRVPGAPHPADDVDQLLDPAAYTGVAGQLVDRAVADAPADAERERIEAPRIDEEPAAV